MDQVVRLLAACEQGHENNVTAILDQGVDIDVADDCGVTALQVAAANGHESLVRLLLMRGAALERGNAAGWTPLLHAARHGHASVVACLLQNRADVHARTRLGVGAAELAARGGHLATCVCLADAGAALVPAAGEAAPAGGELVPLMAAAHHGHDAVVRLILDRGADVNYRAPSTGVTPLMLTVLNDHMTTAQVLIERNADPNLINIIQQTALDVAISRNKREVLGYLDRKTIRKHSRAAVEIKPDIIEAVKQGDLQRVSDILARDPSQRDTCSPNDGATALMFAALTAQLDIAQLLVSNGCDLNKQDTLSGWTALMQATYHGHNAVAKMLINAGADVLLVAKNGCTAFDMASLMDDVDTELYRLMVSKVVEVNEAEKRVQGRTLVNGTMSMITEDKQSLNDDLTMNGLKAWWSRMSNRFRNLKLGRTFNLGTNQLSPLPPEVSASDITLTGKHMLPQTSANDDGWTGVATNDGISSTVTSGIGTLTNYSSALLDSTQSIFTTGLVRGDKPVSDPRLPAFLPPPTFESDRCKMPPVNKRRDRSFVSLRSNSALTHARPIVPPVKLLQSYISQKLASHPAPRCRPIAGRTEARRQRPTSSGVESSLSSATSSTLTDVGVADKENSSITQQAKRPTSLLTHYGTHNLPHSSAVSPSSTENFTCHQSYPKGDSSKDSNSTLTPSPTPKATLNDSGNVEDISVLKSKPKLEEEDDLHAVLKKLSLERYQPIFEEQEVDMEAFLTLTEGDLRELGISQSLPCSQILDAIAQLNSGKGRERQHLHEYMSQFETIRSRSSGSGSNASRSWSTTEHGQDMDRGS